MLSNLLHKHLDSIDSIEEKAKADIDAIIAQIDIKELVKDPHKAMQDVVEEIAKMMEEVYIPKSVADGNSLVSDMRNKKIIVDPSKDPTKNEGAV